MIAKATPHKLSGHAVVPGSKSHTIRAVLLATLAEGRSIIHNPLLSLDGRSALAAARQFGATVQEGDGFWVVDGCGGKLAVPDNYLDCGNSGSVAYFATPMAALVDGYTFVTGDAQIRRRPIDETLSAIRELGGFAEPSRPGSTSCPAVIHGIMKGGTAHFDGKLSQIVSGIMMAAPLLESDTDIVIRNPKEKPYLDITLDWMARYGVPLENNEDYTHFHIRGNQKYCGLETTISGDWSGVAFPLVAGIITGSEIVIDSVNFADSQGDKAVVDVLIRMGAALEKDILGNRLLVSSDSHLHGVEISMNDIPDALPALSVAAAFAQGTTHFTGLGHVRLKETDRVAVMAQELARMGVRTEIGPDDMTVYGGTVHGAAVESHGDHRVAMALLVCGLAAEGCTTVKGAECAAVSFPNFFEVMDGLGAGFDRC